MAIRLRAEDEPARTRTEYWQHVVGVSLAPYQFADNVENLRSEIYQAEVGALTVLDFQLSALRAARTPALDRKSVV